jgi:hypothetical protein
MDGLTTTRPRHRARVRSRTLVLLGLLSVCLAPACYTLVQHPGIARRNYQRPDKGIPCASCHTNEQLLAFTRTDRIPREQPAWDEGNHPWWVDARLRPDSASADSSGAAP